MFYGQWRASVDDRWRLTIPSALAKDVGNRVLVYRNESGFVQIEKLPKKIKEEDRPYICHVKRKIGPTDVKRVLIPFYLRGSRSFSLGKKVTVAGMGGHIELWPR